ncbi:hypothetical protein [Streptosporangium roseum]|uniref:ferredoxin n=1 Tax=Streptosporangium roseum TaxID=2001 RepID=UPI00315DD082
MDEVRCRGAGQCVPIAPEVFDQREAGGVRSAGGRRDRDPARPRTGPAMTAGGGRPGTAPDGNR